MIDTSDYINKLSKGDLRSEFILKSRIIHAAILLSSGHALDSYFHHLINQIRSETEHPKSLEHQISTEAKDLETIVSKQHLSTEHIVT